MRYYKYVFSIFVLFVLAISCNLNSSNDPATSIDENTSSSSSTGIVSFQIDLSVLNNAFAKSISKAVTITSVEVTLSRSGYEDIVSNLAIENNIASGQINNIEQGYWHVTALVFDNADLIYTGEVDVNIIANATVSCTILFDPVENETPVTEGSLDINVAVNPLPGYKNLNITQSKISVSDTNVYIYDSTLNIIAMFDSSMVRIKDIPIEGSPISMTLANSQNIIYLGYSNGRIYSLNPSTEVSSLVCDTLMEVEDIVSLNNTYLLAYGDSLKTVNVNSGQIIDTESPWYSFSDLELNSNTETVYTHTVGVSPSDVYAIKMDFSTGEILESYDSIYHGDYSIGYPVRVIKNGTRLITRSGTMFLCSNLSSDDLTYSGSIGYTYVDAIGDDTNSVLYILNNTSLAKLLILDYGTDFLSLSLDILGTPEEILQTADTVLVFVTYSGKDYVKVFNKSEILL